ncbi:hypothetical protein FF38_06325 [Lucilia cuprina]|uniref:Uncharacterized protein n=1 Tax=Lucilia cuprina TaxID=7375 RepID=A0A0L0BVP1_LUCCU|nr:hypothetical protein FF38_06325 [Lucilia cuprina]
MSEVINNRVDGIDRKVVDLETNIDKKVADLETNIDKKVADLELKLTNLQYQEGAVRIIPETSSRIKAPRNMWNNEEKALELILALKENASVVLESVPVSSRNNYDDIMEALQRKYGGEHKKELYRMQLRGRVQKAMRHYKTLHWKSSPCNSFLGEHHPFLDIFKIEAFVNDIRDPKIKHAVCATPKSSFAETVSFALAAKIISNPQI